MDQTTSPPLHSPLFLAGRQDARDRRSLIGTRTFTTREDQQEYERGYESERPFSGSWDPNGPDVPGPVAAPLCAATRRRHEKGDFRINGREPEPQNEKTDTPEYGTELVYVRWTDAMIYEGHEYQREEVLDKSLDMESCGILIEQTPDRIILALDHATDTKNLRCILTIPAVCIKCVKRYKA